MFLLNVYISEPFLPSVKSQVCLLSLSVFANLVALKERLGAPHELPEHLTVSYAHESRGSLLKISLPRLSHKLMNILLSREINLSEKDRAPGPEPLRQALHP